MDTKSVETLLTMLAPSRADDYTEWVQVGMALRELGPPGLVLWDTWSTTSTKYLPGECAKKWSSFRPGTGITLRSLYHWAHQDSPGAPLPRKDDGTTTTHKRAEPWSPPAEYKRKYRAAKLVPPARPPALAGDPCELSVDTALAARLDALTAAWDAGQVDRAEAIAVELDKLQAAVWNCIHRADPLVQAAAELGGIVACP